MKRRIINQCAQNKRIQNLASDIWVLSVDIISEKTQITVFNRLFNHAELSNVEFKNDGGVYASQSIRMLEPDIFECIVDAQVDEPLWVLRYQMDERSVQVKEFIPFRLEKDALNPFEVDYLKRINPYFEVLPSFSLNSWQCMCSYVNQEALNCKCCGQSKHDNVVLNEGLYRKGMLEDAIRAIPKDTKELESELYAISINYKVPLEEVKQEYHILLQEEQQYHIQDSDEQEKKPKRKPIKITKKTTLIVGLCILCSMLMFVVRPYVSKLIEYTTAVRYLEDKNYNEARDIFYNLVDYKSSREKFVESYFLEADALMNSENLDDYIKEEVYTVIYALKFSIDSSDQPDLYAGISSNYAFQYATKYLEMGKLHQALMFIISVEDRNSPKFIEFRNLVIKLCMDEQDYYSILSNWWLLNAYNDDLDVTELQEIVSLYINHDYNQLLESDVDQQTFQARYSLMLHFLTVLTEYDVNKYLNQTLELSYEGQIYSYEHFGEYYNANDIFNVLYTQDYKDSRTMFVSDEYVLFNYWLERTTPVEGYIDNSLYLLISPDETEFTLHIEAVGNGFIPKEFMYSINALGVENATGYFDENNSFAITVNTQGYNQEFNGPMTFHLSEHPLISSEFSSLYLYLVVYKGAYSY